MTLVDEYLRAVSYLLPKAERDDIIAELRDIILTRLEAREEELGRPLTDAEVEAELHEIGHPLVVAARYRQAPQSLVSAELYPYWEFAVKVGVLITVFVTLLVFFIALVSGHAEVALQRAIGTAISTIISIVGVTTIAAWMFGRFGWQAKYLERWRVRDLRYLALEVWDFDSWLERLGWMTGLNRTNSHKPAEPRPASDGSSAASPSSAKSDTAREARAAASEARAASYQARAEYRRERYRYRRARRISRRRYGRAAEGVWLLVFTIIFVLWWAGAIQFGIASSPAEMRQAGIDPGPLSSVDWAAFRQTLFWPVLGYAGLCLVQGAVYVSNPGSVRLQGLIDLIVGAAFFGLISWVWNSSALAAAVHVDTLAEYVGKFREIHGEPVNLAPIITIGLGFAALGAIFQMIRGLGRLLTGAARYDHYDSQTEWDPS